MTKIYYLLLLAVVGYFMGCIQSAYILGRIKGFDIREQGSKNAGATNIAITIGKSYGFIVAAIDIAKAAIPMVIIRLFFKEWHDYAAVCGFFVVIGHVFPVFMGFKGGKGTACLGGMMLGFSSWMFLIGIAIFILVMMITNYMFMGVFAVTFIFPVMIWFVDYGWIAVMLGILIFLLSIYKHIENIKRFFKGEEVTIRYGWKHTN